MEHQKTLPKTSPAPHEETPAPPQGSGLLQQAKKYGDAARRARENCSRDGEADRQLIQRRNKSGQ